MSPRPNDRDPASASWPAHMHAHLQGAAGIRPDSNDHVYTAIPGSNHPVQPWTAASGPSSAHALDPAIAAQSQARPPLSPATRPPLSLAAAVSPDLYPSTAQAASATRTRIFDPARDLNPTLPSQTSLSPVSPYASSSHSGTSRTLPSLYHADQNHTGQTLSSCVTNSSDTSSGLSRQASSQESPSRYNLEVLEHPVYVRASTFGDRDRRVINPPPILRLSLNNYNPDDPEDRKRLTWAYNIVTCTLWRVPHMDAPLDECVEVTEYAGRNSRRPDGGLMGTLVANPLIAETPNNAYDEDSDGPPSCYYIFSDLSCRSTGLYRLRFGLVQLSDDFLKAVGSQSPTIAYAWTEPFEVFSAKDFPGVRASSKLLRYLKMKGANVTIKKDKDDVSDAARKRARAPTTASESGTTSMSVDAKRSRAQLDLQYSGRGGVSMGTGFPGENGPDD